MGSTLWIGLLGVVVLLNGLTDARKYGRNCGDIGCLTTEKCVLLEDPCTIGSRGECGSYPSCVKIQQGCEKINCHRGEYCINENGQSRCVPNSYDPRNHRTGIRGRRPTSIRPVAPTPPPRSSSNRHGARFPPNSIGTRPWNRISDRTDINTRGKGYSRQGLGTHYGGPNYHNTHVSQDKGTRVWRFSG